MSDEVKRFFTSILNKVNGLNCVLISDRDGVPLLKLSKDNKFPELGTKQSFLSTFSIATVQSSKMMLGKNKQIILCYKSSTIVQLNKAPLIITFVGTESTNIGHLLTYANEVDKYLEEYKIVLEQNLI
ncbi:hypothetical protein PVAND_005990 [Polypedilum vanderplanki]|uniref:Uncharacterized protein n=1 Tax=Polypedilum vanderplanki TaxID=319348 RepID=A0A9J6C2V0_POLVA|nr:hypothetical protein PVAND_005990 [Polypedilum vanderplanki]